jgi:hypothetical protein
MHRPRGTRENRCAGTASYRSGVRSRQASHAAISYISKCLAYIRLGIVRLAQRAQLAPQHHLLHFVQRQRTPRLLAVLLKASPVSSASWFRVSGIHLAHSRCGNEELDQGILRIRRRGCPGCRKLSCGSVGTSEIDAVVRAVRSLSFKNRRGQLGPEFVPKRQKR